MAYMTAASADLLQLHLLLAFMFTGNGEDLLSIEGLDDWILSNLDQPTLRRARVSALVAAAQPFQYQRSEVLMVIGTALSTSVK
jgi:hypothetical protein